MTTDQASMIFNEIKAHYDLIPSPKSRHADLDTLKEKFEQLQRLKNDLGHDHEYIILINGMSQVIAKLEKSSKLVSIPKDKIWSNLSERGMNKVIPPIMKRKGQSLPLEWMDRWGNTCSINEGHWKAKNYTVMDAVGYMFLMKMGGDCLPKNATPIFNDLHDIQQLEKRLNGGHSNIIPTVNRHFIRFTDDDFRKFTGFGMSSTQITNLLLKTSRVEFKLTFPVRLKSTGSKENTHRMNYYSRFFEIGHEDITVKSNGVVLARRYHVAFNTLLGELFVNNLLAKFNDRIDIQFYLLADSAQTFYRRALLHNNFGKIEFNLATIADYAGLNDNNQWNLGTTVETNILEPLIEYGYIDSYEKIGDDPKFRKYIILRSGPDINGKTREEVGSVKDVVGSVKDVVGSVKRNRCYYTN
jgi:hypothetical protein